MHSRILVAAGVTLATGLALAGESRLAALSGGEFTVVDDLNFANALPAPLSTQQLELFSNGRQEFNQRWVVLHSIGGNWGRGPTSNAQTCADCQVDNGRGHAPETRKESLASMVVRLSIPGKNENGGPRPHPNYGDQLQNQGELGRVPPEGEASIAWNDREEKFADGSVVMLRAPQLLITNLAFGPLGPEVMTSVRIAPAIFGAGLLDAVTEEQVLATAEKQKARGFNGRPNYVWNHATQATAMGRFGWKASQPTLMQQDAFAFLNDLGVTTPLFQHENCPDIQVACRKRPLGRVPEQPEGAFNETLFFTRALDAPARRHADDPEVLRGELLFAQAQCAACHVPAIRTGDYPAFPALGSREIHPYTDLLLHDMGDGLADGRPDFLAGPRDWRTPPLWGIGLSAKVDGSASLLHDGRARNLTEAIVWHDGEAAVSRNAFMRMPKQERDALLAFLNSL